MNDIIPRRRIPILVALVLTLAIGIASRKTVTPMPYWLKEVGDVLWTMALYWTIAFLRPAWSWRVIAPLALGLAWISELSQLSDAALLRAGREVPVMKMLLGRGFSWIDMAMYPIGAVLAVVVDGKFLILKPERPGRTIAG